jgi:hypothetical protein
MSDKTTLVPDSKERVALELMEQLKNAILSKNDERAHDPVFLARLYEVALDLVSGRSAGIGKIEQLLKQ